MIRNLLKGKSWLLDRLVALQTLREARQALVDHTVSGTDVAVDYTPGKNRSKRRARRFYFNYGNLNQHGCPWPGRAAARARHRAGSGRRPK